MPNILNRESLIQAIAEDLSDIAMAKKFDVSKSAIFRARKRFGLPPSTHAPIIKDHTKEIIALVLAGKRPCDICGIVGLSKSAVSNAIVRYRAKGQLPLAIPQAEKDFKAREMLLAGSARADIRKELDIPPYTMRRIIKRMLAEGIVLPKPKLAAKMPRMPRLPREPRVPRTLRKDTAIAVRAIEKRAREAAGPQPPSAPAPQSSERIPGLAAEAPSLVQDNHGCLYGVGDVGAPGFHFCGDPRQLGKPYCPTHFDLCHLPARGRRGSGSYRMAAE